MPGITVSALNRATVSEDGMDSATFTVVLKSAPTADVTIAVTTDKTTEASVDKANLTFTATNWNMPQTVTIKGVADETKDGDQDVKVVLGASDSTDTKYKGLTSTPLPFKVIDVDQIGLIVTKVGTATATTEKGGTIEFKVRLRSKPSADVTVPVASSVVTEGTVSAATLTFTAANFKVEQTLTVTGVNDEVWVDDKDKAYKVSFGNTTSTDAGYAGLSQSFDLTNTDDDAITQVASYWSGTCVALVDGRTKCWGRNDSGALGLGDTAHRGALATQMGNALPFLNLGTGRSVKLLHGGNRAEVHQCAVLDNNTVKCWGLNQYGQLGYGDVATRGDQANEMGDTLGVVNLGTGRTAKKVIVSNQSSCAILDNDTLKCWGFNGYGNLGLGDTNNRGDQANEMGDALPVVNLGTGRTAKDVVMGNGHTCALLDNNTVKCWGYNVNGELGLGDVNWRGDNANEMGDALPAINFGAGRTVKSLGGGAGANNTCALLDNDTVKCWGYGGEGRHGLGDSTNRGDQANEMGDNLPAVSFGTGRTVKVLSTGHSENCVILDNDTVKCWGYNGFGQLGLGDVNNRGDNANEMGDNLPVVNLGTGRRATIIVAGTYSVCALLDNGALKCWGINDSGWGTLGLGDGNRRGDNMNEMGDNLPGVKIMGN